MILGDEREQSDAILENVDGVEHLAFREDGLESYDYLINCNDDTEYKVERKTFEDFVQSWQEGKLSRQLEGVDLLIVEQDSLWTDAFLLKALNEEKMNLCANARKHLTSIAANMWVIETLGPEDTVRQMRYIEKRGGDMAVRANNVTYRAQDARRSMLEGLPHINVERELDDGTTVGDELEELVDWDTVVDGMNLNDWLDVDYIGIVSVRDIGNALLQNEEDVEEQRLL